MRACLCRLEEERAIPPSLFLSGVRTCVKRLKEFAKDPPHPLLLRPSRKWAPGSYSKPSRKPLKSHYPEEGISLPQGLASLATPSSRTLTRGGFPGHSGVKLEGFFKPFPS